MSRAVLIVDDEEGIRQSLTSVLRDEGYAAESVASGEECLEVLKRRAYDLVLLDIWLNGMDGLETLRRLNETARPPVVVVISGHGNIETAVRATKLGAFDFIEKPLALEKILVSVRNALAQARLREENRLLRAELNRSQTLMGEASLLAHVRP